MTCWRRCRRAWMPSAPSARAMRWPPLMCGPRSAKSKPPDALRWGVAAGTASARLPGMNFATLAQTEEIYKQVEVRQVE